MNVFTKRCFFSGLSQPDRLICYNVAIQLCAHKLKDSTIAETCKMLHLHTDTEEKICIEANSRSSSSSSGGGEMHMLLWDTADENSFGVINRLRGM